jgi:hypothetical protein
LARASTWAADAAAAKPAGGVRPRYPGTIDALSDLAFRWMRRPGMSLETLVAVDPVAAGAVHRLAAQVGREDAARGVEAPPGSSPGVTAAEAAASRERATALAGGLVELAGRIGAAGR